MQGILLDSSIWICYLRPRERKDLKAAVQQAFSEEQVYTCWAIKAEVLIGARDESGFARLFDIFRVMPEVQLSEQVWEATAHLGHALRRQGLTVPLPDLLIDQSAIENDLVLWHVDEHFEYIRRFSSL